MGKRNAGLRHPGGRPRKDGPRQPCGRLRSRRHPDLGTPQLRARRRALVGTAEDPRAESALGILAARLDLTPEQVDAGRRYAVLFFRAVGPAQVQSSLSNAVLAEAAAAIVSADPSVSRVRYLAARHVLNERGQATTRAVDGVTVYEQLPADRTELARVLDGLDALRRHFFQRRSANR